MVAVAAASGGVGGLDWSSSDNAGGGGIGVNKVVDRVIVRVRVDGRDIGGYWGKVMWAEEVKGDVFSAVYD